MLASSKVDREATHESDLTSLRLLLGPHLEALERRLKDEAEQFEPEIRELTRYCMAAGGKRIRASLVFLGGWRDSSEVDEDQVTLAAVVELVHLATLVHDDILDSASTRHSRITAARKFGPSTAVLLGDVILAQAVKLSTGFPETEICRQISIATRRVCAGEIAQTLRRGDGNLSLREYYRIVNLKTAELFSVSGRLGAQLAGFDESYVSAVADFGRRLGVAYQIYDDLVDFFGKEAHVGKTLGTDLRSGKRTLPLILLMERLNLEEREALQKELHEGGEETVNRLSTAMVDLAVYEEVVEAILTETAAAEEALVLVSEEPPTRHLLQINDRFKAQVRNLRSTE